MTNLTVFVIFIAIGGLGLSWALDKAKRDTPSNGQIRDAMRYGQTYKMNRH